MTKFWFRYIAATVFMNIYLLYDTSKECRAILNKTVIQKLYLLKTKAYCKTK